MGSDTGLVALERQQEILRRAFVEKVVRIKDLAPEYGVHEMTIRRDLDQLAEQGQLERIHGGARIADKMSEELSHHLRVTHNPEGKERIARAALALISDGDAVALDASTTSLALARLLPARNVQAFVTGLDAAEVLASSGVPFILIGGQFHPPARSFVGSFFHDTISRLHPDKVFLSAKGYSPTAGFTDPHLPEVEAKMRLDRSGGTTIMLLDHTKFGRTAFATIANTHDVDIVITDKEPSEVYQAAFQEADVRLIVAEADPVSRDLPSFRS
jgi:DeoR/GlpR family transcriptional regulator of sugar metabolism